MPSGLCFVASFVINYEALHRTSAANASLIGALQPVIVMLVAVPLFGERVGRVDLAWSVVALAGIALFVVSGRGAAVGRSPLVGDLLALVNLGFGAGYFVQMKRHRAAVPVAAFLAGTFVCGALFVTPYVLVVGAPVGAMGRHDLVILVAMVLGPGMTGHGLMTWVQRHVPVGLAAMSTLAATVLAAVGAWIVFGQPLAPTQIAGGAVVLAALGALLHHRTTPHVGPRTGLGPPADG